MLRRRFFSISLPRYRVLAAAVAATGLLTGCGPSVSGSLVTGSSTTPPTQSQSTTNSGPTLGYIWSDKAQTLRPIQGVPGSTQLGQNVVTPGVYATATTSALSKLALLEETDGSLDVMSLPNGQPARLSTKATVGAQLRFAPSGLAAIAFVPGATSVTLVTNLSGTPAIATVSFPAPVSEAAVSDTALVAAATGLQVQTASASAAATPVAPIATLGGLSFVPNASDLLIADSFANTLTLIHNGASAILPNASLLHTPTGVAASRDGHYAVLANSADTNIVRIDLSGQTAPQAFSCACQPAFVAQLGGTGVFRVTSADSGPAWMFDASSTTPRVLFIPASSATPAAAFAISSLAPQKAQAQ